jgi:hypothetical protein
LTGGSIYLQRKDFDMVAPNTQPEGNSAPATGAAEQPTSPTSAAPSQPLPDYVTALQSQVENLAKIVNGVQKGTDKRFGQLDTNIKRILELKDQGLNESQIQRELWIDQQMTGQPQSAPVQQPAGSGPTNTGIDVEATIKSFQFPENDPGLAALRVKFNGRPQELLSAAAELRLSQVQTPNPSGATGLSMQNSQGGLTEQARIEQETQNYLKDMQGAAGKGFSFGDAVKDKYRKLGVPVDNIQFKFS